MADAFASGAHDDGLPGAARGPRSDAWIIVNPRAAGLTEWLSWRCASRARRTRDQRTMGSPHSGVGAALDRIGGNQIRRLDSTLGLVRAAVMALSAWLVVGVDDPIETRQPGR